MGRRSPARSIERSCGANGKSPPTKPVGPPRSADVGGRCQHRLRVVEDGPDHLHVDADPLDVLVEQRDYLALRGGWSTRSAAGWRWRPATRPRPSALRKHRWASGKPTDSARKPIVVRPRMEAYSAASTAMFPGLPRHDPAGGRALDPRGVPGRRRPPPESPARRPQIAERLRRDVRERVGIPVTVGVARTKFLAKVASGVAKPDGLLVVPVDGELAFLHALPVERLWVSGRSRWKLRDVVSRSRTSRGSTKLLSKRILGRAVGRHLFARWRTTATRAPVVVGRRHRSTATQRALGRRARSPGAARDRPPRAGRPARPGDSAAHVASAGR